MYDNRQSSMSRDSDECPICLLPLAYKINYILQPCRHKFHKRCIEKWGHEAEVSNINEINIMNRFNDYSFFNFLKNVMQI